MLLLLSPRRHRHWKFPFPTLQAVLSERAQGRGHGNNTRVERLMCLLPEHPAQRQLLVSSYPFLLQRGVVEIAGNEKSMKKFAIWFRTHPLHFDTTVNDSWRCFMCFSYHGGRFVHRGLKGTCEGSSSSQHKEHYNQPLNMQGTAQAHHRRSCGIVVPAFLGYWFVWCCWNHLSRTCKA